MTKLDEAIEAAIEAGAPMDTYVESKWMVTHDDGTTSDGFMIDGAFDMAAALKAAVKALVPEEAPVNSIYVGDSAWNNCCAQIIKNAGME